MNTILGPRGLNPVEAQGRPRFAKWHLRFLFVVRGPITLRLLYEYMQDIEEVYILWAYPGSCFLKDICLGRVDGEGLALPSFDASEIPDVGLSRDWFMVYLKIIIRVYAGHRRSI